MLIKQEDTLEKGEKTWLQILHITMWKLLMEPSVYLHWPCWFGLSFSKRNWQPMCQSQIKTKLFVQIWQERHIMLEGLPGGILALQGQEKLVNSKYINLICSWNLSWVILIIQVNPKILKKKKRKRKKKKKGNNYLLFTLTLSRCTHYSL